MKSATCHRTIISLIKKIRSVKASALFAALYKENMLQKTRHRKESLSLQE